MHSNNVMMDWDDVYQEIWKKIIRCRHTWNESKGTMVSTWITIVANSVINTLRQSVNKYRSRYCLYDDICSSSDEENESSDREKCDFVQFLNNNSEMMDKSFE
jgi:DNA-directed RNA polymerase specialized sigma24 family protein